jgi:hypothetical protein
MGTSKSISAMDRETSMRARPVKQNPAGRVLKKDFFMDCPFSL